MGFLTFLYCFFMRFSYNAVTMAKKRKARLKHKRRLTPGQKAAQTIRQFQKYKLMPKFLSARELAKVMDVCEVTVYRLARQGKIPAIKFGDLWRFDLSLFYEGIGKKAKRGARS